MVHHVSPLSDSPDLGSKLADLKSQGEVIDYVEKRGETANPIACPSIPQVLIFIASFIPSIPMFKKPKIPDMHLWPSTVNNYKWNCNSYNYN